MTMRTLARLAQRLRIIFGRRSFEQDLEDELRFHIEMATSHNVATGMSAAAARDLTRRQFGSMDRYKDEVRDAHGITWADDFARDIRFSLRALRRTPGFTALALLTFVLGIGANTAIFSVVNAVLLRPLPYAHAERLVRVFESLKGQPEWLGSVSVPNFKDWQQQTTSFDALAGYSTGGAVLEGSTEPERVRAVFVTANLLPMLGARPLIGRSFVPEEEAQGKNHVVVLSEALWRRRFSGDPAIVGRTISIEGETHAVVGVMPAGFNFPMGRLQTDLWAPFSPTGPALTSRGFHWMSVVGALKPGVTLERGRVELAQIAARLEKQYPDQQVNRTTVVMTLQDSLVSYIRPALLVLFGAVVLVLLIACANVANLLLARNASRRKDVAVRVALGANRGQLMRQFLTESVVLALGGAALGLAVARLGLRGLTSVSDRALPIAGPIPLDARVLLALLGAAVLCGLAFGLAPALQLTPAKLRDELAGLTVKSTGSGEMRRFRNGLVVGQIALSLMLLVGAGLLMRAFIALQSTDSGLESERVLTARLAIPGHHADDGTETAKVLRPLLEQVRAIPGVQHAGITSILPIENTGTNASFWVDRRPWPAKGTEPLVEVRGVSPGYFAAMSVPIKAGRDLEERDDSMSVSKVLVNETLVRKLFPNENPIGRHLLQGGEQQHMDFEVVGVVRDVKQSGLANPPRDEMYASYADLRAGFALGDVSLVVKTAVPELSIVPQLRRALRSVANDVALTNVRSMGDVIERSLASQRLLLVLFAMFAAIAVMLAASGLYGVVYYLVMQRTREIGIRVALGADKFRVIRLVLGQGAALVVGGIAIGLLGALFLSRLLASLLYGVGARDPLTFVSVPLLLAVIAMLATLVPAVRATRVDPVIALRAE